MPYSSVNLCKLGLFLVLLQICFSYETSDGESDPGLAPLTLVEKPIFWVFIEDRSGGGIPVPVFPGNRYKLPDTIIPYPRTGRMLLDSDIFSLDPRVVTDKSWLDQPFGKIFELKTGDEKKASIGFPPRIGRKKRSISEEEGSDDDQDTTKKSSMSRSDLSKALRDYFYRKERKPNSRSKITFVPRVGKKSDEEMEDVMQRKRAAAFTPRIGRASLIPRMGRNDPRFQVQSRGAFIPRIGRRATFTPRIGRFVQQQADDSD